MVNYDKENCDNVKKYYLYYYVEEMAMLWCGISPDDFKEIIKECKYKARAIPIHPYIQCLEYRARAIMDAIDHKLLAVGRDGKHHSISDDHIAPERRTILKEDFKKWLLDNFPEEKPKSLFDEIERSTHKSITIEAYQTLEADRNHLKIRIENAEQVYKNMKAEIDALTKENTLLKSQAQKIECSKKETTYLNIIGGLLSLLLPNSTDSKCKSLFINQTQVINTLISRYPNKNGISERTLQDKFSKGKNSIAN